MKIITLLLLCCLFISGCDHAPDNRQLSESIVRLQNEVDLAHEWIVELREENRNLKWRHRIGAITRKLEYEYLINNQHECMVEHEHHEFLLRWKPKDHERLSITRMLDEAIDKCKSSKRPDRLDMSEEQMIDEAIDGCRSSGRVELYKGRPDGYER